MVKCVEISVQHQPWGKNFRNLISSKQRDYHAKCLFSALGLTVNYTEKVLVFTHSVFI